MAAVTVVTAISFYLNVAFALAISSADRPRVRPGFEAARRHSAVTLTLGVLAGLALGVAAVVVPRWGPGWFGLAMGVAIGGLMVSYVALPCRILAVRPVRSSRRDALKASAVSGAVGAAVGAPGYLLGRIGVLLLGSGRGAVPGVILIGLGASLYAGAGGAMRTITIGAKLLSGRDAATSPDR